MKVLTYEFLGRELDARPGADTVVVDIDSTIMDTAPRNLAILHQAAEVMAELRPAVARLGLEDMGWHAADAVTRFIDLDEQMRATLRAFWRERFFSGDWVLLDQPYPGAKDFLHYLRSRGLVIIYLTGRDEPNMGDGTRSCFASAGLPVGEGVSFRLKPDPSQPDLAFKMQAMGEIAKERSVALAVDNDPAAANVMLQSFPEALVLLANTVCAPDSPPAESGLVVFDAFETSADR